jgi:hypothetical protein
LNIRHKDAIDAAARSQQTAILSLPRPNRFAIEQCLRKLSLQASLALEEFLLPEPAILEITAIIVLGIGAQWLAWRIQLPSILLVLLFGFLAGRVTGYLDPNRLLGDLLLPIASISVAVILFEGGLSLNVLDLSRIRNVLIKLISLGAAVTLASSGRFQKSGIFDPRR